ncbi:aminoglycoside phosphotransferase [Psychrobacter urativorans]|uniref:Aminoglycoside phosphotransferase n=2 Tax=Psychrobacter urativorans TaxID=45610 RepID=A0A0M3V974_9GAMM|nr:phosphotransferase [Psychrobacter urativorans]ALF60453.1 aminoglycoside phosphotransferase [Psychrobacter urativorans]
MTNKTLITPATTTDTIDIRQQQLEQWLQQVFEDQDFILDSLAGDASARRYHRIQLLDSNGAEVARYIVMDSADEQDAMQQFIMVDKLMMPAINVPKLIAQDLTKGFLVLQDFGAVEFAHLLVGATPAQVNEYYQLAMQTLVELQKLPVKTAKAQHQLPDYDAAMLTREMNLFSEWFIPYIGVELDEGLWENLKSALIAEILAQPQVIVHRDYHSRNLMQDQADKTRLGVIDFQDAVIGAYSYDLVSLVRDAYVEWSETQVSRWIHDFWQLQKQAELETVHSAEQFENDVNVMGVQRHLKVLGIFIRLFERDGKNRYLTDIPKVMCDFIFELEWLGAHGSDSMQQAVEPFNKWLIDTVLPAYQNKFVQQYI